MVYDEIMDLKEALMHLSELVGETPGKRYKMAYDFLEKEIQQMREYINYVTEYPEDHEVSQYPACYRGWLDNDYQETI
jgi:hypothetical protein